MLYDCFICHASEDKESFVRPLAEALQAENVEVWYDEFSLKLGDSIRRSIDKGLKQSRFGVVVISKAFLKKKWPQYELDGLAEREMAGKDKVILPIWHNITHDEVLSYSSLLAGRKAVFSSVGLKKIVSEILSIIHPQRSPLIVARDILLESGLTPPVITDQYWLEVVEASNRVPGTGAVIPEESTWDRWSFPLPPKDKEPKQWGERLAWTAMQLNWVRAAEEIPITILTPPEKVIDFIHSYPGLFETCATFPGLLVEYAPQITIPGMGGDLDNYIEKAFQESCIKYQKMRQQNSSFGSACTVNKLCPLCDEEWSIRHPTFGDYQSVDVSEAYFSGGMFGPSVSPYEHADHLFWLLSTTSSWLPGNIHSVLLEGIENWQVWPWGGVIDKGGKWKTCGTLLKSLYAAVDGKTFKLTEQIKDDIHHRIELSTVALNLSDPIVIFQRFLTYRFPERFIEKQRESRKKRKSA